MVFAKAMVTAAFCVAMLGCGQGHTTGSELQANHGAPYRPVHTLGPDDGVPFGTPPAGGIADAPAPHTVRTAGHEGPADPASLRIQR